MARSVVFLLLIGMFNIASAKECFEAVQISDLKMKKEDSRKEMNLKSARLEISKPEDSDEVVGEIAELKMVSTKGKALSIYSLEFRDIDPKEDELYRPAMEEQLSETQPSPILPKKFLVECDGGSMILSRKGSGQVVIRSSRIRADVTGCDGEWTMTTSRAVFQPISCESN